MVARADSLVITDPKQAITLLETALPLLQDSEQISIIAHRDLGIAKLCVEEPDSSRACFNYVLRLLAQRTDVFEEITCHVNLGQIEARLGNMNAGGRQHRVILLVPTPPSRISAIHISGRLSF